MKRSVRKKLINFGIYDGITQLYTRLTFTKNSTQELTKKIHARLIETDGYADMPRRVILEPTARCNLNCSTCYLSNEMKLTQPQLDFEKIKIIIDRMPKSVQNLSFTGGEALMHADFFKIANYAKKNGFLMSLNTNGTLLSTEKVNAIKKIIANYSISIDGPRDIHNATRGREYAYDRAISAAIALSKEKKIQVQIVTVINERNIFHLKETLQALQAAKLKNVFFEYERRYDADAVNTSAYMLGDDAAEFKLDISYDSLPPYSWKTFISSLKEADKHAARAGINLEYLPKQLIGKAKWYYYRTVRKNMKCYCGYLNVLRLDSQGNVIPCFAFRKSFGNLLERSFDQIWNSHDFRKYRLSLLKNNLLPICETCWKLIPIEETEQ